MRNIDRSVIGCARREILQPDGLEIRQLSLARDRGDRAGDLAFFDKLIQETGNRAEPFWRQPDRLRNRACQGFACSRKLGRRQRRHRQRPSDTNGQNFQCPHVSFPVATDNTAARVGKTLLTAYPAGAMMQTRRAFSLRIFGWLGALGLLCSAPVQVASRDAPGRAVARHLNSVGTSGRYSTGTAPVAISPPQNSRTSISRHTPGSGPAVNAALLSWPARRNRAS